MINVKPIKPPRDVIEHKENVHYTAAAIASAFGLPPNILTKPVNDKYVNKNK